MRTIKIDGTEYYTRNEIRGYGYEIMEKVPRDDNPEWHNYKRVFISGDKEQVKTIFAEMEKTGKLPESFPEVPEVTIPTRILVIGSKYGNSYFSVPTKKIADRTLRHVLKEEYGYIVNGSGYKPTDVVHNDSGVNSQEELDSIPVEKVREDVQKKYDKYLREVKENKEYARDWENLRRVVEEDKGNPWSAMAFFNNYAFDFYEPMLIEE